MNTLEIMVDTEIMSLYKRGIDTGLIQAARAMAKLKGNSEFVEKMIANYISKWTGMNDDVGKATTGHMPDAISLEVTAQAFKHARDWLANYSYPGAFARMTYRLDRDATYLFSRVPLLVKILLMSPV